MNYAPHILQRRALVETRDEYGRITGSSETWETIGPCRCDDNTAQTMTSENGIVYQPKFKVVCDRVPIHFGDYMRCLSNGEVRGEGKVSNVSRTTYYNYTTLWI